MFAKKGKKNSSKKGDLTKSLLEDDKLSGAPDARKYFGSIAKQAKQEDMSIGFDMPEINKPAAQEDDINLISAEDEENSAKKAEIEFLNSQAAAAEDLLLYYDVVLVFKNPEWVEEGAEVDPNAVTEPKDPGWKSLNEVCLFVSTPLSYICRQYMMSCDG